MPAGGLEGGQQPDHAQRFEAGTAPDVADDRRLPHVTRRIDREAGVHGTFQLFEPGVFGVDYLVGHEIDQRLVAALPLLGAAVGVGVATGEVGHLDGRYGIERCLRVQGTTER